jgi:hypothetical protein
VNNNSHKICSTVGCGVMIASDQPNEICSMCAPQAASSDVLVDRAALIFAYSRAKEYLCTDAGIKSYPDNPKEMDAIYRAVVEQTHAPATSSDGRPEDCAHIYKNGRLKNKEEMAQERGRISGLSFDNLLAESEPVDENMVDRLTELVDGVEVDLDAPLSPEATSSDARCKFCHQLPNMEGDCRCDLDPPQAASEDDYALIMKQSELLTRSVNLIKGEPPELTHWSHHDLPEIIEELLVNMLAKDLDENLSATSDSVTISRETAEYASKALEAYTKNMMFTADQAGKVSWYKQELKQALEANPMQVTGGLCE